jgi:hypothetical protein
MNRNVAGLLLSYTLLWALPAGLARPLDTDDTGTVSRGKWEVEGGIDYLRVDGAGAWALTPVLAYGVSDRLQVDFGCDYLVEWGESGDPDARSLKPSLQFKYRWWSSADGRLSFALKGNLGWPVQQSGPSDGLERHGHLRLLVTKACDEVEFDFNTGYDFADAWGGGDDAWIASAGFRRSLTASWEWVGEVFVVFPERSPTFGLVATGAKLAGRGGWTFDALVGVGVGQPSPDLRIVLGFVRAL